MVILKEANEFLEIFFSREVMPAVWPDSLKIARTQESEN